MLGSLPTRVSGGVVSKFNSIAASIKSRGHLSQSVRAIAQTLAKHFANAGGLQFDRDVAKVVFVSGVKEGTIDATSGALVQLCRPQSIENLQVLQGAFFVSIAFALHLLKDLASQQNVTAMVGESALGLLDNIQTASAYEAAKVLGDLALPSFVKNNVSGASGLFVAYAGKAAVEYAIDGAGKSGAAVSTAKQIIDYSAGFIEAYKAEIFSSALGDYLEGETESASTLMLQVAMIHAVQSLVRSDAFPNLIQSVGRGIGFSRSCALPRQGTNPDGFVQNLRKCLGDVAKDMFGACQSVAFSSTVDLLLNGKYELSKLSGSLVVLAMAGSISSEALSWQSP